LIEGMATRQNFSTFDGFLQKIFTTCLPGLP
jgi:hypothetical protein